MLHIAVIGFGGYGWKLVQELQHHPDELPGRLVAAADGRLADLAEQARQLEKRDVALYDDAHAMLDEQQGRCDVVMIATGIASHRPLLEMAVQRGYHIHLEKPPAAIVQDVDAMARCVQAAGVCCLVGFQHIHENSLRELRARIRDGRLGSIEAATCRACWPRAQSYYDRNDWAGRLGEPGRWILDGPASNALSHQINNLLYLLAPAGERFATPQAVRGELYVAGPLQSHNTAAIELHLPDGLRAQYLVSHAVAQSFGPVLELHGSRGNARWSIGGGAELHYDDGRSEHISADPTEHLAMLANLLHAVQQNRPEDLRCTLEDTRKMVLALNAAHESSGRVHRIPDEHVTVKDKPDAPALAAVGGLEDVLAECARRRCLPGDLPDAPSWAVPTEPFDTAGYAEFPQRFIPRGDV